MRLLTSDNINILICWKKHKEHGSYVAHVPMSCGLPFFSLFLHTAKAYLMII